MARFQLVIIFIVWVGFSFLGSEVKALSGNCGKVYPVDYILFTNLFCEVETNDP